MILNLNMWVTSQISLKLSETNNNSEFHSEELSFRLIEVFNDVPGIDFTTNGSIPFSSERH